MKIPQDVRMRKKQGVEEEDALGQETGEKAKEFKRLQEQS